MKITINFSFIILLLFILINCSTDCVHNEVVNKKWEEKFNISYINLLIDEPKSYCHKEDSNLNCVELVILYDLYSTKDESPSIFTLRHEKYQNACQALNHFNEDYEYWSSELPKYELRYGPVYELLQDSSIYLLLGHYAKTDSIGDLIFLELKKSLGLTHPEKNSVFKRKGYSPFPTEME